MTTQLTKPKQTGPEKPTIIERVVNLLPGPFLIKCLIFWTIFGTPGMVLTRYLDTFNFDTVGALFGQLAPQNIAVFSMANFVMPFYAFCGTWYMRRKILGTMPELEPATASGTKALHDAFSQISKPAPALILGVLFAVVSIVSFPAQSMHVVGYLSLIVKAGGFGFGMLGYGTFIWMYASSIRGLHQLGKHHLHFVSFYEDEHLGMRPLGTISLSLALVYFLGIGLVFFSATPVPIALLASLLGLILLGVVLFFLPLHVVHEKMAKEKHSAEKLLKKRLSQLITTIDQEDQSSSEITDMLLFQTLEQKVSKISDWPFDTVTLSWFSAIVITVLGTIITRYLLIFLGL